MHYMLYALDKPNALPLRKDTREDHLTYVRSKRDMVKTAGPLLDGKGDMIGSLMILEAESLEAVREFNTDDPYTRAGLFESVEIRPFAWGIGKPD